MPHARHDERVSTQMPEFEMPHGVPAPARPDAAPAVALGEAPAHTAEPDDDDPAARDGRRRINWRHVLVAGVVGVLVGAAIPGGIQVAERAAVSGDQASLRATAMAYLTAIADGRASDATAMVAAPAPGKQVPDAVLQSAERITEPAVRLVHIDGDAATVEVEYRLGEPRITRTLQAERIGGAWQISRPLTEAVPFHQYSGTAGASIAGFEIPFDAPLPFYPGIYRFDAVPDDPIIVSRSEPFRVDGDPTTPTEPFIEMSLVPAVAERAEAVALAVAERCMEDERCAIPPDASVRVEHGIWVTEVSPQTVDVVAQLTTTRASWMGGHQVVMRIDRDAAGDASAWRCSPLDAYELTDAEDCPAID